jgi:peroxin-5
MGASLAHLGRPDEAIHCYHKALDIKPNYVRVWVNLGIAHGFKSLYEEAARFYLNALSFRPDAKHIWAYLQTTFMSMQRYDLIKLISQRDPSLFTEFDVMKVEDLPTP